MVHRVFRSCNVNLTHFLMSYNDEILHSELSRVTIQYSIDVFIYFYIFIYLQSIGAILFLVITPLS